jgi:flagellin-like hook-associated protein FlgL
MKSAALLVELFTEELPPKTLKRLGDSFAQSVFQSLNQVHLIGANAKLQSFASPRRLALLIEDVVLQAPDHPVREKLLPTSIAFDERGQASAPLQKKLAALGYANTPISQLEKSGEGKNEALYLNVSAKGADLQSSLQVAVEEAIKQLPIAKMMHYQVHNANGDLQDVEFARPVHRIVAMHDSHILPIQAFGMTARNSTTTAAIQLSTQGDEGIVLGGATGMTSTGQADTGYSPSVLMSTGGVDLSTANGSQAALTVLDKAINTITDSRASMGAYQNRLTASVANLETTSMNLQASRSRILDTDYAKETTMLAKSQIIQQAATAMLAQANQSAQSVLSLLK